MHLLHPTSHLQSSTGPLLQLSLLLLLTAHLTLTHALDIQDVNPDALDKCAGICEGMHTQMLVGACRRAHPEIEDIGDLDTAKCHCTDGDSMKQYAECIARRCPVPVLVKAYNVLEKGCVEGGNPVALTRDEFIGQAGASASASASASAPSFSSGASSPSAKTSTSASSASAASTGTRASSNQETEDPAAAAAASPPPSSTATTATAPTSSGVPPRKAEGGLSTSDKVAIGVGLGVGIPTMVIALLTFLTTCKWRPMPWLRRRQKPITEAGPGMDCWGGGPDAGAGSGSGSAAGGGDYWGYGKGGPIEMAPPSASSFSSASTAYSMAPPTATATVGSWPVEPYQHNFVYQYPYRQR